MTDSEQRAAAKIFAETWQDKGYEKGETHIFWTDLLRNVLGIAHPERFIVFEHQVRLKHTAFIDAYIPATRVMIEQKGKGIDLDKPAKQSDGSFLTPFQQAKRYADELKLSEKPRWIVVCNFREFRVHDMERPHDAPEILLLADLPKEFYRLSFLADDGNAAHLKREMELSVKAGELVGRLYDEILRHYRDPAAESTLKSLNMLCVRLVFCLYAEDAGIFGSKNQFHDYLARFDARDLRRALIDLFQTLNTRPELRDPYLDSALAAFPYVNGGLFAATDIEIPQFDDSVKTLLLAKASDDFNWSEISPTIFGAVFESTLNPETRRAGGMHYTSVENIHKVIDPLFLDALKAEFAEIVLPPPPGVAQKKAREKKLRAFQEKLAALTFFDPACGSGNFLTETYISLRRLENDVLRALTKQIEFNYAEFRPIQVSIGQFYGIEINDFAVSVAQTALWIAESQMMRETEDIVQKSLDFLPLKSYANIREGNALRLDWASLGEAVSNRFAENPSGENPNKALEKRFSHFDYIMGNPPFVGYSLQTKSQKEDILSVFLDEKGKPTKTAGKLDYVSAWFYKTAQLIAGTPTRAALVATNSVCQGEQVAALWKPLFEQFKIRFAFAYRTFRWDSDASDKAHVHCVIIGFSSEGESSPCIFTESGERVPAKNINPYLIDAPDVFVESRKKPICNVPEMTTGNRPADGGNLIIEAEDYEAFIKAEPGAQKFIKRFMGSEEFINGKKRYCLWLVGASPAELRNLPKVRERVEACLKDRANAVDAGRRKLAETPSLFRETKNPEKFIVVPKVSSERRNYVPIDFLDKNTICSDLLFIVPSATLYHFGVLTSFVHMAWMRAICGRLKSDYRYSASVVYNNFPWPSLGEAVFNRFAENPSAETSNEAIENRFSQEAKFAEKITQTAQAILDARERYPDCSLADLYDETTMPPDLRRAHRDNDRAVLAAYGFPKEITESQCVSLLMRRYNRGGETILSPRRKAP